jgi:hypothetical protein
VTSARAVNGPGPTDVTEPGSARSAAASLATPSSYSSGATAFAAASGIASGNVATGLFPPVRQIPVSAIRPTMQMVGKAFIAPTPRKASVGRLFAAPLDCSESPCRTLILEMWQAKADFRSRVGPCSRYVPTGNVNQKHVQNGGRNGHRAWMVRREQGARQGGVTPHAGTERPIISLPSASSPASSARDTASRRLRGCSAGCARLPSRHQARRG